MAILIPSILARDAGEVHEKLKLLESIPELQAAQIDFADGKFVPNELPKPAEIMKLETRLTLEAHLMVFDPQHYLHDLEAIGVKIIFIHYESFHNHEELMNTLKNANQMGFRVGLALNPNTEVAVYDAFSEAAEEVILMGVNPGFQGQEFISKTLDRLQELRQKHKGVIIEVDGGVKLDNVQAIVAHGADKVNVGSAIWQTPDPKQTIKKFIELLKK